MIEGKIIYLRAMELSDMELYREMINEPEISNLVVGWSFPISNYEQQKWYEKVINDKLNLRFTVVDKETDIAVGMVTLTSIDWKNRNAFHGIKLSNSRKYKKGTGTDSVMTLMKYAFEELQMHRLNGSFIEYNKVSQALYKKCGWSIDGIQKEAIYRNGQYHDKLLASILRKDYYNVREKLGY